MMTYLERLQPIKSPDTLVTRSCEISCQTKTIISSLPQSLWNWQDGNSLGLAFIHLITWHFAGLTKLCDKMVPMTIKLERMMIYLKGLFIHKVIWPFWYEVLEYHVTNQNRYISTTKVPIVTKLGRMLTYLERLPSTKLQI